MMKYVVLSLLAVCSIVAVPASAQVVSSGSHVIFGGGSNGPSQQLTCEFENLRGVPVTIDVALQTSTGVLTTPSLGITNHGNSHTNVILPNDVAQFTVTHYLYPDMPRTRFTWTATDPTETYFTAIRAVCKWDISNGQSINLTPWNGLVF